jgi:hypothetical protein
MNFGRVGLVEDGPDQGRHPGLAGLAYLRQKITKVVRSASLPARAGQGRGDRGDQPGVRVGGDQHHPGQAAGHQAAEERQPPRAVLGGGDLEAGDLPVPVGVDPGGDQPVHQHGAAALADPQGQRVGLDEPVRPGIQRPGPELLLGGTIIGVGVASMHYMGMWAMRMPDTMGYDRMLLALSVLIAIVAGTAALWAALRLGGVRNTLIASLIMGVAVSGMHYTGMAALRVQAAPGAGMSDMGSGATGLALLLPLIVGITAVTFILTAMITLAPTEAEIREDAARWSASPVSPNGPHGRLPPDRRRGRGGPVHTMAPLDLGHLRSAGVRPGQPGVTGLGEALAPLFAVMHAVDQPGAVAWLDADKCGR